MMAKGVLLLQLLVLTSVVVVITDAAASSIDDKKQQRDLQTATTPSYFKRYRSIFGRRVKKCKFLKNSIPQNNTFCQKMKTGPYTCLFGSKTCSGGEQETMVHPDFSCDCGEDRKWKCESFDACPATATADEPPPTLTCPAEHPASYPKIPKCSLTQKCFYGSESCCGQDFPISSCDCVNGEFICKHIDVSVCVCVYVCVR